LQYYSFVTITTLGYGDTTPVTRAEKSFSVLEAVVGQLYVVVVIAWLVGNYVRQK
jgi:voltage-gated potassium channel